ncbi:MAG: DEAD/DEAH box helicase [Rhodospirillales bacterium]|nr:DEAD/DEAH box helicase [Rhodospirillales bacterium]
MEISTSQSRVVAVLGPTNTGKTHLAMDRMLAHATGMIGFPLRLLARENYQRAVAVKGYNAVALITGEEKILPMSARYFICTTESMPVDRRVDFMAIDEIQMCADPDRGHIFTDRLLNARGRHETMFLGAETLRPLIRRLVPDAEFQTRPRFSTLTYVGAKKITRLPKRSAIVAFSASDVYAYAELIRRQKGGAAVVMGALSPRTRNAQVALYQSGEVDYIVATDAIGMGLNMDVDHVAFAATRKFDGHRRRPLEPAELAQIAGRAGRHMNDGTFGTTGDAELVDPEVIGRIENHEFEAVRQIYWRNPRPRFASLDALVKSLSVPPELQGLARVRQADDELVLRRLVQDPEIIDLATTHDAVRLLWDVCQVPDFGNIKSDGHARTLARIYRHLMKFRNARLPEDWIAEQIKRMDRTDGDIEHLTTRIAGIRTWIYIAYRADWLENIGYWQERTRAIEDRLSDALHERLTQRFVDRRTTELMRRMKEQPELLAAVKRDGEVVVEGHYIGRLDGFRFVADQASYGIGEALAVKAVELAAVKALRGEIERRTVQLVAADDTEFRFAGDPANPEAEILWQDTPVCRLMKGPDLLRPHIAVLPSDLLEPQQRDRIATRLTDWLKGHLESRLRPLFRLSNAQLSGPARGLAFQMCEQLGSLPRRRGRTEIDALSKDARRDLRAVGVRIGRESVYVSELLKPHAIAIRALLWAIYMGRIESARALPIPLPGRVSIKPHPAFPASYYEAIGFRVMGTLAVRIDMIERIAELAWQLNRKKSFPMSPDLLALGGCGVDEMTALLKLLGYRSTEKDGVLHFRLRPPRNGGEPDSKTSGKPKPDQKPAGKASAYDSDSPFAVLSDFKIVR